VSSPNSLNPQGGNSLLKSLDLVVLASFNLIQQLHILLIEHLKIFHGHGFAKDCLELTV
jgi:hypothetical protein